MVLQLDLFLAMVQTECVLVVELVKDRERERVACESLRLGERRRQGWMGVVPDVVEVCPVT